MRVFITPDWQEANPYLKNLSNSLRDQGHKVTMLKPRMFCTLFLALFKFGVPDVIHIHWTQPFLLADSKFLTLLKSAAFLCEVALMRALRIRVVMTVHNILEHRRRHVSIEKTAIRLLANLCSHLIFHCRAACKEFARVIDRPHEGDNSTIIPHGHYIDNYENRVGREEARSVLGYPASAFIYLCPGAVRGYKGLDLLFSSFNELPSPDIRLIIAGRPHSEKYRKELSASVIDNRIQLKLYFIPDEELQLLMNAADAVVLPYRDILTSGAAILAMSFKKAVIAPKIGCLPELFSSSGGILYDPDNPEALKTAMEEIIHADWKELGEENFQRARQFNWKAIAEATVAVYSGENS